MRRRASGSRGYEQLAELVLAAGWVDWVRDLEVQTNADADEPQGSQALKSERSWPRRSRPCWRCGGKQGCCVRPTILAWDIERATSGTNSTVLVGPLDGELVATTMVGHDGHRGWVYYLEVDGRCRGSGFGREMIEAWLSDRGVPKLNLMVRGETPIISSRWRVPGPVGTAKPRFDGVKQRQTGGPGRLSITTAASGSVTIRLGALPSRSR